MKPADLRVIKTKENIQKSLLKLLKTYSFQQISVKMIIGEARINRSTFYRNYSNKDTLLKEMMDDLLSDLDNHVDAAWIAVPSQKSKSHRAAVHQYFEFVKSRQETYLVLWKCDAPFQLYDEMYKLVKRKLLAKLDKEEGKIKIKLLYTRLFPRVLLATTRWWFESAPEKSVEEMTDIVNSNVERGFFFTMEKMLKET